MAGPTRISELQPAPGGILPDDQIPIARGFGATGYTYKAYVNEIAVGTSKAPVGGNDFGVFYENDQLVITDYTITTGRNAMSVGPITIRDGVTITVPNGSTYTVVQ